MKIEKVKISQLKINPNNPRKISDDQFTKLKKSIQEFPEMLEIRPIVVNDEMVVLGGNMRLLACTELKIKEVFIIKASTLTEEQQKRFIVSDNVEYGLWDKEKFDEDYWNKDEAEAWGAQVNRKELEDDKGNKPGASDEPAKRFKFTISPDQEETILDVLEEIKERDEYKYAETFGNMHENGNALYVLCQVYQSMKNR